MTYQTDAKPEGMSDAELAAFLGISDLPAETRVAFIAGLTPERRALFDRMHDLEGEIMLWQAGVGKKPEGVILCGRKQIRGAGHD